MEWKKVLEKSKRGQVKCERCGKKIHSFSQGDSKGKTFSMSFKCGRVVLVSLFNGLEKVEYMPCNWMGDS